MPEFSRLRVNWSGRGYHGFYVESGTVHFWSGQPPFDHTRSMFDVPDDRYVKLEDLPISDAVESALVPKWHPLDIRDLDIEHMPVITGHVPRLYPSGPPVEFTTYPVDSLVEEGLVIPVSWWHNFPGGEASSASIWNPYAPHINHLDMSSDQVPVQTVLASCNPTRAEVDIPANLTETIFGLAELVLLRGKSLSGHAGKVNLSYQFGWKPLIADFKRVLQLSKFIDRRVKKLTELRVGRQSAKGNIHKTSKKQTDTFSVPLTFLAGPLYMLTYEVTRETTLDQWGCVDYMVPSDFIARLRNMSPPQLRDTALKQLTKAEFWKNPSGWWEVTPWSWLADWFFSIQDVLERYSTVELLPWRYCVMTQTTTKVVAKVIDTYAFYEGLDVDISSLTFKGTITTRTRYVGDDTSVLPNISGSMPTITNRQAGILASLFAIYKDIGRKVSVLGSLRRL